MIHKFLILFVMIFIFSSEFVWSQAAAGGASGTGSASGQPPSPGDFPQYIVTPREDLDNYNYSNMNKSNFSSYRENVGNFGKPLIQQNNIEINAELQKMEEKRKNPSVPQGDGSVPAESTATDDTEQSNMDSPETEEYLQPTENLSLYRWIDSDGVLHVTDDFGSIPPEYQEQAYKSR